MLNFIKFDLNISKIFFDEFLICIKKIIKKPQNISEDEQAKLLEIEEILNNKLSNKEIFFNLWNKSMSDTKILLT